MQSKATSNRQFSEEQGQVLVQLARQTLMQEMGKSVPPDKSETIQKHLQDQSYDSHCGTFVTLKIEGQLRGCIGNLTSTETVLDGITRNALNAAFHDPRFAPLSQDELDRTASEVSILSEPC